MKTSCCYIYPLASFSIAGSRSPHDGDFFPEKIVLTMPDGRRAVCRTYHRFAACLISAAYKAASNGYPEASNHIGLRVMFDVDTLRSSEPVFEIYEISPVSSC